MFMSLSNINGGLFDEFMRLERGMDHLFGEGPRPNGIRSVARGTYPSLNIGSTPDQVDVYLYAAGLNTESLELSIQKNLLTIDGERRLITEKGASYFRRERFDDAFHRVVTLPDDVDPEKVDASYKDGVLRITIRRRETAKPRQIAVK